MTGPRPQAARCTRLSRLERVADLSSTLQALLINLDSSDARLARSDTLLTAAGLEFQRVPAVDGRGRAATDWPCHDKARTQRFFGRPLRGGEVGCYLSHIACLEKFVQSRAEHLLVFEDDLNISPEGALHIRAALNWLAQQWDRFEWDVINLGRPVRKFATPIKSFGPFDLCAAHYFPLTTTSLAWSRPGAVAFLAQHDSVHAPIDDYLRWWCGRRGRGLAFRPSPVTVSGDTSTIHPPQGASSALGKAAGLTFQRADLARRGQNYALALRQRIVWRWKMV